VVSGTDETLDVTVTFTRPDVITIPPDDLSKLVINVDTTCAQYITINSSSLNIGTVVTDKLNITVLGTAPSSQCSFQIIDTIGIADPPLNCEAMFTITQAQTTTTSSVVTSTTIESTTTTTEEPTSTTTIEESTTTTAEPTTTTTVPATDCIAIEPDSVQVSGTNETLDVTVTFTRTDVITIPPEELNELVISIDPTCAQYITINSSTINIGTEVTADLNITVQGDAPSSQCSIQVSDPTGVADPPLNCEATFTITQVPPTTTTTVPTTTTTIPEAECTVKVESTFLPLNAGLLPHVRRIKITGEGSTWDRTSAVSIEDIMTVIPLRVQPPNTIYALIVIPGTLFGRSTPGEKAVGVATGAELCTGTVDIP
jgi:hypothetical protein